MKEILGLPPEDFFVPDDVLALLPRSRPARREARVGVDATARGVARGEPGPRRRVRGVPRRSPRSRGWEQKLPTFEAGEAIATREASEDVLSAVADLVPGLIAGLGRPHRQHRDGRRRASA